ncbi:hypothetical protein [Streptomyces sp. MW-W600-10]|uniref:hypothetical protein n=1 Tax=Streptomyces sp. MW-W600-10 TaxID=2829819 RepID=UPI001C47F833|nr:hypothetical protein [Streptomyces sp. MW-W600-10]MBV7249196.1 hypothetical protein [Streptomyces sp. MW-W600-10]
MDEITVMRAVCDLLLPLSAGDRAAALGWLTAMLGEGELSASDRTTAEAIMAGGVLPYGLYARGAALAALGRLNAAARARAARWASSVLLDPDRTRRRTR